MEISQENNRLKPVGIFDSGVGGLSVAIHIAEELPRERLIYYADSARAPWGVRSPDEIIGLADEAAKFLIAHGAKVIVVACNTASVHALKHLRAAFADVPFVGMVPAVKPAAQRTRSGRIGVLATEATARGEALAELISEFVLANEVDADVVVPNGLVEQVERGELDSEKTLLALESCLNPMLRNGTDTLVLGCTHFPFLRPAIERVTQGRMQILDAGAAVARQCGRVLAERGLLAPRDSRGGMENMVLYTSGDTERVGAIAQALLRTAPKACLKAEMVSKR